MPQQRAAIQTGFLIHDVTRLGHQIFDEHIKPLVGITRPQWWLLISLTNRDSHTMTQVELARLLDIGKVALGKMVDRLEAKGFVVRTTDNEDRRSKSVRLTQKGEERIRHAEEIENELSLRFMLGIAPDKQRELEQMLATIKQNLLTIAAAPAPPARAHRAPCTGQDHAPRQEQPLTQPLTDQAGAASDRFGRRDTTNRFASPQITAAAPKASQGSERKYGGRYNRPASQ
ncbi:MAG: transcriptional regulator [Hydrocarboniphaga sp.]|uniref:MarR family winged helix-turn-helix transcriptional regulator n=1 Tax=Hydrocarboniphaga sp. TaxID=2033016 RepID=UPI00263158E3|nr:MarR family transcriptional regulator [Hydrocarboniphaga sp.]MDB5968379.1 transcriptional regulator [Hydrocarboniphaga sp.]